MDVKANIVANSNTCPNCGTPIGCSCQIRTASNGVQVCSSCAANYENQLRSR